MKVERVSDQVMIKDVKPGECFERGHGICIKTTEKDPDGDIQVVDLRSGELHHYPADDKVTPLRAEIKTFDKEVKND